MLLKVYVKGKPCQPNLQHNQIAHKFNQEPFRHQQRKDMEGAGQVVHIQRQEIGTDSHIEGKIQALPAAGLMKQLAEKGHILVVHIGKQEASVPKGKDSPYHKQYQHNCRGNQKRKNKHLIFLHDNASNVFFILQNFIRLHFSIF